MPRIFDNIEQRLLPALCETIEVSDRADFCVGYLNLRGWRKLDSRIEQWSGGEGNQCRLLVGMQRLPDEELRAAIGLVKQDTGLDQNTVSRLRKKLAEEFREQLAIGVPTDADEIGLRRLATQIKDRKVAVKLFLRYPLHAKLYLLFRTDPVNPIVAYLGSSNLTLAGLSEQGELNIDVLDGDACQKLAQWFEDRWNDRWCVDISDELVQVIEESWAREDLIPPYHIYVKMAYHLSREAQDGLREFSIPREFRDTLFEFQAAGIRIAAHHLNRRGGVLIGDVVGLGKTLMATALASIFEEDQGLETLILCPKNLTKMWEDYRERYRLRARVLSITRAMRELPNNVPRYRLVIIDESHNLRNREGKRYQAIHEYIQRNESKCVLLTATPYNKTYLDLSNQLRLFVPEHQDLGTRPERLLRLIGEREFLRQHQCPVRSLAAFEHSEYADDWRELMRLYMVRRPRSFIQENYALMDCPKCGTVVKPSERACPQCGRAKTPADRKYLTFADGTPSYFPKRVPRRVPFRIEDGNPTDQYARLYARDVEDTVNDLRLPRYGLGNYLKPSPHESPTQAEERVIADLSRAGRRLMGFCRTNLFKRLESSGHAFIQSVERHILRNYVFLHAINNGLPLPIGTQGAEVLDARVCDEDADSTLAGMLDEDENDACQVAEQVSLRAEQDFLQRADEVYEQYRRELRSRFKWLRTDLFIGELAEDLVEDARALAKVLQNVGDWQPERDEKLAALEDLLARKHAHDKVIVFTQFADTARYLEEQLKARGLTRMAGVTGDVEDPTGLAWRFSPVSNNKRDAVKPSDELRVLVATDVLSEGQNLQDCAITVNYDLPWAIIRLVQRVGRVDRIGQKAENILCYSFWPADGVERIINLRARVRQRLKENAEVVGTDEAFFEDDRNDRAVVDLYNENVAILDGEEDTEVDLSSYAYEIWNKAVTVDPSLARIIPALPDVVYSTRSHEPSEGKPEGALVYVRTAEDNDALAWIDAKSEAVTESQFEILKAAECTPDTPALPRLDQHHELVSAGVKLIVEEERSVGGQLGRPHGAKHRTYTRLKDYAERMRGTLFDTKALEKAIEEVYRYPLFQAATDALNRQLRSGISDEALAELVLALREEDRLCVIHDEARPQEPRIICSMGLSAGESREATDAS